MNTLPEKAERVFHKSIDLIEQRLKLKVKNAVMLLDTDFGEYEIVMKDNPQLLFLMEKFFHERLTNLTMVRSGQTLINCDKCLGLGEIMESNILNTCTKCHGGGTMVAIFDQNIINQQQESTNV